MRVSQPILGVALLLLSTVDVGATAQESDVIVIDSQEYSLFCNPLSDYLEKANVSKGVFETGWVTTGNWRGYRATWTISDGMLWLSRLDRPYGYNKSTSTVPIPIDSVFPGQEFPIAARWYSGTLTIPQGEMVQYVHMGYASTFDHEIRIRVFEGAVGRSEVVDYSGPDNFRSMGDYMRCPQIDSVIDTGDWIDGRFANRILFDSGATYRTRGILEIWGDSCRIVVPSTKQTEEEDVYWGLIYSFFDFKSGMAVEVWLKEDLNTILHMRQLHDNESIHTKRYMPILDSLMSNR